MVNFALPRALQRMWPRIVDADAEPARGDVAGDADVGRLIGLLVQAMSDAVLACDPDGRLVVANRAAAELLGQDLEQLERRGWPEALQPIPAALRRALDVGEARLELALIDRPGPVVLSGRANRIEGPGGPIGAVMSIRAEPAASPRPSYRANDWEMLAHDLKTPLSSISGFATLLLQEAVGPINPLQRDFLETIQQEGRRLTAAVLGFLKESREDEPAPPARQVEIAVPTLAREAIDRLRPLAMRKGLLLAVETPDDLPLARGEDEKLGLVLLNLLDNAIGFSPAGGRITIAGREAEGELEVSVEDQGAGIPEAELALVFERYYRASNQPDGRPGVGLGLAICKQLVEQQGGQIWAERGETGGARIVFTVPRAETPAGRRAVGAGAS